MKVILLLMSKGDLLQKIIFPYKENLFDVSPIFIRILFMISLFVHFI